MKKKCTNNSCSNWGKIIDVECEELFCEECGEKLLPIEDLKEKLSSGTSIQQDNRIHKGDKITVGGDSFNAQSIDNRTVTNTSNTTINNISNVIDESRKIVMCEISGKNILITDSVRCPKCGRCVSKEYYVEDMLLCKDCYDKVHDSHKSANASHTMEKVGIPPLIAGDTRSDDRAVVEPINGRLVKNDNHVKRNIIGSAIVLLVLLGGFFILKSGDKEEAFVEKTDSFAVNKPIKQIPLVEKTVSSPKVKVTNTTIESTSSEVKKETPKPEISKYEAGKKAYEAGNYTKASLMLEQSLQEGKSAAAYYLGMMYKQGKGMRKNVHKAFTYMKQAAEGGVSDAYYELGEMYRLGKGTEPNRSLAKKWYEAAVSEEALNSDKALEVLNKYR